jgi:hypothetical protein
MSGGGGGGGFGGGGPGGEGEGDSPIDAGTACGDLRFTAVLQSVQPDAAEDLVVGEVLEVGLRAGSPPVIEVRTADQILVGALIQRVPELLRCLQQDFRYEADVISVEGGYVRVEVHVA